jgi:hypothetical protein
MSLLHHHESPLSASYKTSNFLYEGTSGKCIQIGILTKLSTGEKFEFLFHSHLLIASILAALKHSFDNQVCLVGYQELVDDYLATLFDANKADYNEK